MKKLSETYKELGIAFSFPIEIKDADGTVTYYEGNDGYWCKYEYDAKGNRTHFLHSCGYSVKLEYDANGNQTYYEDNNGFWREREYDANGNETYYEDSCGNKNGTPRSQSCDEKVIEVDGKKYKLNLKHGMVETITINTEKVIQSKFVPNYPFKL